MSKDGKNFVLLFKVQMGAGRVAQWVKALAAKSGNLSSAPGIYQVEREDQLPQITLTSHNGVTAYTHNKYNKKFK